jgi:alkane 1-monooxygenase
MIHRKQAYFRFAGIWNLLLVNYSHFYVEHIRGHHKNVGTSRDAATAHYGESFYRFFLRTVPAQYSSALNIEAERLKKKSKHPFGFQNLIIQLTLLQVALSVTVLIFFGRFALLAYLHQSLIAFFLLEYVNYIEHYGLSRAEGARVNATHSWQSDMPVSRFALIELSRHADHHVIASKPYYRLSSLDDSPYFPQVILAPSTLQCSRFSGSKK